MKSLTTLSKINLGGLIVLLAASVSLSACSSISSAQDSDQARLTAQADEQSAEYQGFRDAGGFRSFDNQSVSPGVNFGRWMAGQSD